MTGRPEVAIKHYVFLIIHLPFVIIHAFVLACKPLHTCSRDYLKVKNATIIIMMTFSTIHTYAGKIIILFQL